MFILVSAEALEGAYWQGELFLSAWPRPVFSTVSDPWISTVIAGETGPGGATGGLCLLQVFCDLPYSTVQGSPAVKVAGLCVLGCLHAAVQAILSHSFGFCLMLTHPRPTAMIRTMYFLLLPVLYFI